jgi:hypothetical protein
MNADKFSSLVRAGNGTVHVTNVVLHAEGYKLRGQGMLRITPQNLELDLEISARSAMPKKEKVLWRESDFWNLRGIIDGDLPFTCDRVSPGSKTEHWGVGKVRTIQTLRLPTIDLKPVGWDKLTDAQRRRRIGGRPRKTRKFPSVIFEAVLVGCEPVFLNAGTTTTYKNDFLGKYGESAADTFFDKNPDYDFALVERDKDLHLHMRSRAGFRSKNEEDDRRRFQALLNAIGFTHGFQPWPYRVCYWRDGRKIGDHIKTARTLPKTIHAPFDEGLGRSLGQQRTGARNSPVRIAARFFENGGTLAKQLSHLLFLCRASGAKSVDMRVHTLALCSLFEGIVDLLFDHLNLEAEMRKRDPRFDEYVRQRDRLSSRLRTFGSKRNSAFRRLAGSLEHARTFRVKDKFRAICAHFGLKYKPEMKRHFDSWAAKRNPLSHGRWDSDVEDFVHQSRIAGAINIFVLKLMGFSGRMKAVTISADPSETYRVI